MRRNSIIGLASALVLALALVASLFQQPGHVTAAPQAIITPVASVLYDDTFGRLTFLPGTAITSDTAGSAQNVSPFRTCDIQWDVNLEGSAVNTTTLKLQFSNDNVYWSDGATIEATIASDSGRSTTGSGKLNQFAVFGRYGRTYADVTNSSAVTPTVSALCH